MQDNIIWFNKNLALADLMLLSKEKASMSDFLGIDCVSIGPGFLQLKMPVNERTRQPYDIFHGGASCALAETAGSIASHLVVNNTRFLCAGLEINANHVRSATHGFVTATATPLHQGSTTHVWDIKISDDEQKLICVCRLTVAILDRK